MKREAILSLGCDAQQLCFPPQNERRRRNCKSFILIKCPSWKRRYAVMLKMSPLWDDSRFILSYLIILCCRTKMQ